MLGYVKKSTSMAPRSSWLGTSAGGMDERGLAEQAEGYLRRRVRLGEDGRTRLLEDLRA